MSNRSTSQRSPSVPHASGHAARDAAVLMLAVVSGATDAIGFLTLGGAFTSVMTGNMVLFGLGVSHGDGKQIWTTAAAIVSFMVGCLLGARVAGTPDSGDSPWPRPVTLALALELALFLAYATGYELADFGRPGSQVQVLLLALTAVGLGVQSAAIQRFGVSGLSTTYMTGTLTTVVARLATGSRPRDVVSSIRLLVGLIAGAVAGGLLALHVRALAPLLQIVLLGGVLIVAERRRQRVATFSAS